MPMYRHAPHAGCDNTESVVRPADTDRVRDNNVQCDECDAWVPRWSARVSFNGDLSSPEAQVTSAQLGRTYRNRREMDRDLDRRGLRVLSSSEASEQYWHARESAEQVARSQGFRDIDDMRARAGSRELVAAARERAASEYADKYGTNNRASADSSVWRGELPVE